MQYLIGSIGVIFVIIALLYVPHPTPFVWAPYAGGALLALMTFLPLSQLVARILAIATTVLMFFFFAGFFLLVPQLAADWYRHQEGWGAVCLLLGAFAMIPLLSDYSCQLKRECREARLERRRSFFSVPAHLPPPADRTPPA